MYLKSARKARTNKASNCLEIFYLLADYNYTSLRNSSLMDQAYNLKET